MTNRSSKPIRIMDFRGTYKGGGGPDKTILNSALLHDKRCVDVLVTYLRDPKDKEFQITDRAKKLGIPFVEVQDRRILDILCLFELNRLLKKYRIDILHAHDDKTLLYGWLLKIINPNLKIIYTCHLLVDYKHNDFPSLMKYFNYRIRKYISVFLMKRFLRPIMAVSGATKKQLIDKGFKKDDIIVLYNGIDINFWKPDHGKPVLKEEMNLGNKDFLVGTVARVEYQKDFPTFFKVAEKVSKSFPNVKFVIVGEGKTDEVTQLKEEANRMKLGEIFHYTGHRNDLLDVYNSLDIFLMTSIFEGLPNTVLEAMAMGIPVVSTAVAGVPELVIDSNTGYLCRIGDFESLSDRVIKLLGNKGLRDQYASNGRKRIEEYFSFEDRVRKLEDLYEFYRGLN